MRHTRRSFLRSSAASALALSAAPILRAAEATTKAGPRHTVALVGAGWWGTNILRNALADGRSKLVALCDVDSAQLKTCADAVGKLTSDSVGEMIRKVRPWGVDVCSGTEKAPGVKDRSKIRDFMQAAREAHKETTRIKVRTR
jgi:hypothetical protein